MSYFVQIIIKHENVSGPDDNYAGAGCEISSLKVIAGEVPKAIVLSSALFAEEDRGVAALPLVSAGVGAGDMPAGLCEPTCEATLNWGGLKELK